MPTPPAIWVLSHPAVVELNEVAMEDAAAPLIQGVLRSGAVRLRDR